LWWEVDEATALEELSADVVDAYERYGKPWFDKTGTLAGLIDATPRPPEELAAAGAFALGEHDRARTLLSNAISGLGSDASTAERRQQLRACVDRWGLRR
jgi:hypothetical protein